MASYYGNKSEDNSHKTPKNIDNIKEKLNLHVKRKLLLQESSCEMLSSVSSENSSADNEKKIKNPRRTEKSSGSNDNVARKKKKKLKSETEDDCSREEFPSISQDKISADDNCPELLNMVLNSKKQAVFHHPEVIKFLEKVVDALKN